MENNNQENETNKTNEAKFKTVSNPGTYKAVYEIDDKPKKKTHFGRTILLPFFSGVVGCAVVIGTCFTVPSIRNSLLGNDSTSSNTSSSFSPSK